MFRIPLPDANHQNMNFQNMNFSAASVFASFKLVATLTLLVMFVSTSLGEQGREPDESGSVVAVPKTVGPVTIDGAKKRNVVSILSDDQRYDALGFMGHQFTETPRTDSLAANGVQMKNASVTTSLCSPRRASILTGPTIMEAMGLEKPPHMDGESFIKLAQGKEIPWRDFFLYVYYWEKNFPQSPTVFSLRSDRFKYITYYGLWDTDEFFDIQADAEAQHNLIHDPAYASQVKQMERRLYEMMDELGGTNIPMNQPKRRSNNKRLRSRCGERAADFASATVLDEADPGE